MTEDMRTAGLASGTQALYLDAVRNLAAHYRRSPDELSEEEVRAYLLSLRERGVALGTFKTNHGGIQFLYRWTLDRDWPLFGKKKDPSAEAAAPAVGSAGSRDPCAPGLRQKPRSQDLPVRHVRLRSTHKRGRQPGSRRDRLPRKSLARAFCGTRKALRDGYQWSTVIGDAASGDQAVDVGVKEKLLRPRMQDGKHTDRAADMAWVASEFDDGLGGGLHQDGVAVTLVGAQDLPEFLGHGHGDMEVAGRQHLGLARLEPAFGLVGMAFGTTPILAGVIREEAHQRHRVHRDHPARTCMGISVSRGFL